jgi:hypothetical protein
VQPWETAVGVPALSGSSGMKKKRGRRRHDAEEEENGRRGSGAVLNLKEKKK